jgi:hypothetical protein
MKKKLYYYDFILKGDYYDKHRRNEKYIPNKDN